MRLTPARTRALRVLALGESKGHKVRVSIATSDPDAVLVAPLCVGHVTARHLVADDLVVDEGDRLVLTDKARGLIERWF